MCSLAEDFILFKVLSTRGRDLEDEATMLEVEIPDHDVAARLARLMTSG